MGSRVITHSLVFTEERTVKKSYYLVFSAAAWILRARITPFRVMIPQHNTLDREVSLEEWKSTPTFGSNSHSTPRGADFLLVTQYPVSSQQDFTFLRSCQVTTFWRLISTFKSWARSFPVEENQKFPSGIRRLFPSENNNQRASASFGKPWALWPSRKATFRRAGDVFRKGRSCLVVQGGGGQ